MELPFMVDKRNILALQLKNLLIRCVTMIY